MPILDPSIQHFLLTDKNNEKINATYSDFFNRYLKIASQNLNHDYLTAEASIQFKKDLQSNINLINNKFGYNVITEKDFTNQNNIKNDYYTLLSDQISKTKTESSNNSFGTYFICKENFSNLRINNDIKKSSNIPNGLYTTKFYQIKLSTYHSWYFSDTPIAILCLDTSISTTEKDEENEKQEILRLIKLEIDLMIASGFTLVLCYKGIMNSKDFLFQIIKDDQFSELHLNIYEDEKLLNVFLVWMKDEFFSKNVFIKGFIYLYSCFFEDFSYNWMLLQIFKQYPRTKIILFSLPLSDALIKPIFKPSKPFPYCKTGFKYKYLRVYLFYVPISDNELIKTEVSGLSIGYVLVENFLYRKRNQTSILFFDLNDRNLNKKIYFDNIHTIKPDLFVKSTLSLTQMKQETHESISNIENKLIDDKKTENQNKKQKSIQKKISSGDLYDSIIYVANEYTQFMKKKNKNFKIRPTQIYAVIEACNMFFQNPKEKTTTTTAAATKKKGVVYQIKTGEGKSCIITLIAAILALKGKIVHIVSSNIKLSIRDYAESFDFFQNLELKSSVLLHKNELPQNSEDSNEKITLNDPKGYFKDEVFQNTSRMNFCVCGINNVNKECKGAKVIFSTFVNLECFYLYLIENNPEQIGKYFKQCGLLIDEADSILIDEITNGTIISREIKTNAKRILSNVYNFLNDDYNHNDELNELSRVIHDIPMTNHITSNDIRQMIDEAKLVKSNVFSDGKKYSIEQFEVKNKNRIQKLYKKTCKKINNFKDSIKNNISNIFNKKDNDSIEEEEEEDMNDYDEEEEEDLDTNKTKKFRKIVPFDYDHKGILEENKEFSGFIPQFIALKESENFDDIIFKDMSISYLYISHPIFADLYPNICGFTGTIGQLTDKETFSNHYKLVTKKVPRFKPNLRVDFPMIACNEIKERNLMISNEVLQFHEKGNPVLVIFQDFNEIEEVKRMIFSKLYKNGPNKHHKIIVFDGKNKDTEPGFNAGIEGAISLGTNICGRGTNIQCSSSLPLHVIVAYYSKNSRVMKQAFGRTARNGQAGTCRCICLKKQLVTKKRDEDKVDDIVDELFVKSEVLNEFIEYFKVNRGWIFSFIGEKQEYTPDEKRELKELRQVQINVNRMVAYKFRWPICMNYKIFLEIQAQRIFSIFNCPNSKYTWRLFQRYVREMILQSWSLMIEKFDQERKIGPENLKENNTCGGGYGSTGNYGGGYGSTGNYGGGYGSTGDYGVRCGSGNGGLKNSTWGKQRLKPTTPTSTPTSKPTTPTSTPTSKPTTPTPKHNQNQNKQTKPAEKKIILKCNESYLNDKKNIKNKLHNSYKKELIKKKEELIKELERYLPKNSHKNMISTFINICNQVVKDHQEIILKSIQKKIIDKLEKKLKLKLKTTFVTFGGYEKTFYQLGFKPYTLRSLSGARITYDNLSETNFIEDPELKYERKMPNGTFSKASITERIDFLFNKIFQEISSVLGEKTCLQFFMRRTLAGCEFGICLDLLLNNDDKIDSKKIIIVDKNPLLMFTIYTWSHKPLLAAILLIVLVYVARIASKIAEFIANPVYATSKEILLKAASSVIEKVSDIFLSKVIEFLMDVLTKQIEKLEIYVKKDDENGCDLFLNIIKALKYIFFDREGYECVSSMFEKKVQMPSILSGVFEECINYQTIIKVGLLLILCFATFLKNFQYRKSITYLKDTAKDYNSIYTSSSSKNKVKIVNDDDYIVNNASFKEVKKKIEKDSNEDCIFGSKPLSAKENQEIENMYNNVMKDIIYKLMNPVIYEKEVKITDIKLIRYPLQSNNSTDLSFVYISDKSQLYNYYTGDFYTNNNSYPISYRLKREKELEEEIVTNTFTCIRKSTNQKCIRYFSPITNEFCDYISFFINNPHPSILPFVGYVLNLNNSFLLFEIVNNKYSYKTLNDSLKKNHDFSKDDNTNGLILAYGIACGIEFLEKNGIHFNSIYSRNVLLDDDLHPLIFPFEPNFNSYDIFSFDYIFPPEFEDNQNCPLQKTAVFYFGALLYEISNGCFDLFDLFLDGTDTFDGSYNDEWIDLMCCCLNINPDDRPSFSEICDMIESFSYKPKGLRNYIEKLKPKRL